MTRKPTCNRDLVWLLPCHRDRASLFAREHEYKRKGALHLFAAFDTRTGKVYARTETRKRQVEFLAFLSQLEREIPPLSIHTDRQTPIRARTAGAMACVEKRGTTDLLLAAIRLVRGQR